MGTACWRHRGYALSAVLAAVLSQGLRSVSPLLIKAAVDYSVRGAAQHSAGGPTLPILVTALASVAVVRFAASFARQYLTGRLALGVQHDLRLAVFSAMQRLDGTGQDRLRVGQAAFRATGDVARVEGLLLLAPLAVGNAVLLLASLAAMLWLSPPLAAIALVLIPAWLLLSARARRALYPANRSVQQQAANIAQHLEETVTGVRVVKGFGQESREVATLRALALRLYQEGIEVGRVTARFSPALTAMPWLGMIAVFGVGGLLAMRGQITLGTFLAFCAYVTTLTGPAQVISNMVVPAQLARAGLNRVHELISMAPEITDPRQPEPLPAGPLGVEFVDVQFGYPEAPSVLNGLTLRVKPGETLALTGGAGCGKSTIAALLARFYDPQGGQVLLGRVPLTRLSLAALRSELGMVFQEPVLFSDTIRANIAYGRPGATDEEVRAAATAAHAHQFIRTLPHGYDTLVGERGLTLSGGQRQRLALARALLIDPRILVLDESTAAVDATTEETIHTNLRTITQNRTTILISHQRATLALADRIAVLGNGRILDVGSYAELDARGTLPNLVGDLDTPQISISEINTSEVATSGERPATPRAESDREPSLAKRGEMPLLAEENLTTADPEVGLSQLFRPIRARLAVAIVLVASGGVPTVAYPELFRFVVDRGVLAHASWVVALAVAVGLALIAGQTAVNAAQTRLTTGTTESLLYALRVRSFAHLQRLGLDYYERQPAGAIMTRMTTDIDTLATFLRTGFAQVVVSLLTLLGISIALLLTGPQLALIALAPLPLAMAGTAVFRPRVTRAYTEARERVSIVNSYFQENTSSLRIVQAFCREEHNAVEFTARSHTQSRYLLRAESHIALYFPFIQLLAELDLAVVLAVGAHQVATGELTAGVLSAFLLYLAELFIPLQLLFQVFDSFQRAAVGLSRIGELLRTPTSVVDAPKPVDVPPRLGGNVELRSISFRYPGSGEPALHNISLRIRPGETVALVGRTGAGKSTLIKLIARFYDATQGEILVDGVDIRRYSLHAYRQRLGIVPQEPHLFAGTVASNIAYGRPDASSTDIKAAARAVGALDMISGLPKGFEHPVNERGHNLSAGQRQLIALARTELIDPDLLLLDEATAALDPTTEATVLEASQQLTAPRTTIVVAHRLATAARADRIVVVTDGRISEQGTHHELAAAHGGYAELWRASGLADRSAPRTDTDSPEPKNYPIPTARHGVAIPP